MFGPQDFWGSLSSVVILVAYEIRPSIRSESDRKASDEGRKQWWRGTCCPRGAFSSPAVGRTLCVRQAAIVSSAESTLSVSSLELNSQTHPQSSYRLRNLLSDYRYTHSNLNTLKPITISVIICILQNLWLSCSVYTTGRMSELLYFMNTRFFRYSLYTIFKFFQKGHWIVGSC